MHMQSTCYLIPQNVGMDAAVMDFGSWWFVSV